MNMTTPRRSIEIGQIRYFVAASEHGSFRRAAAALGATATASPTLTVPVQKAVDAVPQEPPTPFTDCVFADAEVRRHPFAGKPVGATRNDPESLRQRPRHPMAANLALQIAPLRITEDQWFDWPTTNMHHNTSHVFGRMIRYRMNLMNRTLVPDD